MRLKKLIPEDFQKHSSHSEWKKVKNPWFKKSLSPREEDHYDELEMELERKTRMKTQQINNVINRIIDMVDDPKSKYHGKHTAIKPQVWAKLIKQKKINERAFEGQRKRGDNYKGGYSDNRGNNSELYQAKNGTFYIWIKSGGAEAYMDLPKNIKDRDKADVIHLKLRDNFRKKKPIKVKNKTLKPESV